LMSDKADKRFGKIPIWVAALGLTGCELRVLLALAGHANDERLAWPSLNTIAKLAGTTVPKVSLAIKKLEARGGLLRKRQRRTEHGDYDSTLYELFPDGMAVLPQKVVPTARGGRTVLTPAAERGTALGGSLTDQCGTEKPPTARESSLDAYWPDENIAAWAAEKVPEVRNPRDPEIVAAFKDRHRSRGTHLVDFDAAFRDWLRLERKFQRQEEPSPKRHGLGGAPQ
jgi:hypothetical protein